LFKFIFNILITLLILVAVSFNHNYSQQVISANGGEISSISGTISYSIGEAVISTISGSNNSITQGYQQTTSTTNNVISNFEADDRYPCLINNEATVSFTDLSSGNPTTWLWDFGDGNTSTLQNPSHTYLNSGDYSISLSINNNQDIKTENNYIEINNTSNCIPKTYLENGSCDIVCDAFNHRLFAFNTGANEYRFIFKNKTDPSIPDVIVTRVNFARTMHFSYAGISNFGHTYEVSVQCKFTNLNSPYYGLGWSKINKLCNVTTPRPTTQLTDDYCGSAVNAVDNLSFTSRLHADAVGGASKYKFTFTNDNDPTDVYVKENTIPTSRFSWIGISKIGATYKVNVQAKIGNNWTTNGNTCYVKTPTPSTKIESTWCGSSSIAPYDQFTQFNDRFWAKAVDGATAYEFYFENDNDPTDNYTKTNIRPSVHFTWMGISTPNAIYKVQVKARIGTGNDWTPIISTCYVRTPSPETKIESTWCGSSGTDPYDEFEQFNDRFWAESIGGASRYKFTFTNDDDPTDVYVKENSRPSVHFTWMGINTLGATYAVTVKAKIGNNWTDEGDICYVMTPNPTTQLSTINCSTDPTAPFPNTNFGHRMYADLAPGQNGGYEFTFTNTDNTAVTTKTNENTNTTHLNFMGLNSNPNDCDQTYAVTVKAIFGNQKTNVGQTCYVKSPLCMIVNPNQKTEINNHLIGDIPSIDKYDFNIYPNPSLGNKITIEAKGFNASNKKLEIEIFDVSSKLIQKFDSYENSNDNLQLELNFTKQLMSGLYFVKIRVENELIIKKFLIQ
jgi:PKD repeat protein